MNVPELHHNNKGFTLVEMLIALAVSGIVMIGVWQAYRAQSRTATSQGEITSMQQNLRLALSQMERDLRMAGFDPTQSGGFGITFVGFRALDNTADVNGNSAIEFTSDLNEDGVLAAAETISFSLYDAPVSDPDGFLDLAKEMSGNRQLLAENIFAMGLAYAYDGDGDKALDTNAAGVIWAIDTNNDGFLDLRLDTNGDGVIDSDDDTDGNGVIVSADDPSGGTTLAPTVHMSRIRAVRIWILARARHPDENYYDSNTYAVGREVITPQDNFRRRLLETVVQCKNMGLN